jgi:hypothetical protein
MNARRYIRANLNESVRIRGTDRWGNPFEIRGQSLDFSRKGLGLLVNQDVVAAGTVVSIDLPNKLHSSAVVQWVRRDENLECVRLGVHLVDPKATWRFRLVASVLLAFALLGQVSYARGRTVVRPGDTSRCTVSLNQMKNVIESKLGKMVLISESEKAFIHLQHQQSGCDRYTHDFEKSGFFGDEKKRNATEEWHWHVYHSQDQAVRAAAVQGAEALLGGTR